MREPVRCRTTGLWLARYLDAHGTVRQAGRFDRKGDARAAIRSAEGGLGEAPSRGAVSLLEFFEEWEQRFPRHPRTMATNKERLRLYIFPHLPRGGDVALGELRRSMLRDVQDRLLRRGLAKETIDGACEYPVGSGCGVISGDLAVGGGLAQCPEPEQCLEGRHWRASAVVAEDELVEVDLQVLG